jgi:hypothetical protein
MRNRLTTLDIANCTALTSLRCDNNRLASLDISTCKSLTYLTLARNLGNGNSFVVTVWPDISDSVLAGFPSNMPTGNFYPGGGEISIDVEYRKAI